LYVCSHWLHTYNTSPCIIILYCTHCPYCLSIFSSSTRASNRILRLLYSLKPQNTRSSLNMPKIPVFRFRVLAETFLTFWHHFWSFKFFDFWGQKNFIFQILGSQNFHFGVLTTAPPFYINSLEYNFLLIESESFKSGVFSNYQYPIGWRFQTLMGFPNKRLVVGVIGRRDEPRVYKSIATYVDVYSLYARYPGTKSIDRCDNYHHYLKCYT
jgi:hypothetical protein